jgi:glutathione S-transferase
MQILEREYPGGATMIPNPDSDPGGFKRVNGLLRLERELFGDWCSLIFRPSGGGGYVILFVIHLWV